MLVRRFEQQVMEHPQNIAIKTADSHLTYIQLNNYANGVVYEIIGKVNKYFIDKSNFD